MYKIEINNNMPENFMYVINSENPNICASSDHVSTSVIVSNIEKMEQGTYLNKDKIIFSLQD